MLEEQKLEGLNYYGGKHPNNPINHWISQILGEPRGLYMEPFAGQLGLLISRPESKNEIVNDAHSWVYNWWKQIRDEPKELAYLIDNTARSRQLFEECTHRQMEKIRDGYIANTVYDAWNLFVVCNFSVHHGIETRPGQYGVRFKAAKSYKIWEASTVGALSNRLKRVQIENVCATRVIEKSIDVEDSIIYCDPPYHTADTVAYGKWDLDFKLFADLVVVHKGNVAISGYGQEWDRLLKYGWYRHELDVKTPMTAHSKTAEPGRTEVLWTNFEYEPAQQTFL